MEGRSTVRTVINGAMVVAEPRKVVLVSDPGRGRVWQRIETPPQGPDSCGVVEPPKENQCRV